MKKLAAMLCAVVSITALGIVTAPAASAAGACQQQLDPDRRVVYKLTNGARTLSYGQVVVQATAADYHRYCIRFQTGGRTVTYQSGETEYARVNGAWVNAGGRGTGPERTSGFTSTLQVRDSTRVDRMYSIKDNDVWYSTIVISRYNL